MSILGQACEKWTRHIVHHAANARLSREDVLDPLCTDLIALLGLSDLVETAALSFMVGDWLLVWAEEVSVLQISAH